MLNINLISYVNHVLDDKKNSLTWDVLPRPPSNYLCLITSYFGVLIFGIEIGFGKTAWIFFILPSFRLITNLSRTGVEQVCIHDPPSPVYFILLEGRLWFGLHFIKDFVIYLGLIC